MHYSSENEPDLVLVLNTLKIEGGKEERKGGRVEERGKEKREGRKHFERSTRENSISNSFRKEALDILGFWEGREGGQGGRFPVGGRRPPKKKHQC